MLNFEEVAKIEKERFNDLCHIAIQVFSLFLVGTINYFVVGSFPTFFDNSIRVFGRKLSHYEEGMPPYLI